MTDKKDKSRTKPELAIYSSHPGEHFTQPDSAQYPDLRAESRAFGLLAVLLLFVLALVGGALLYLGSPASRSLHIGKLERMYAVREFYEAPPAAARDKPLYLAIGDSVTLSGFNGYAFDAASGGEALGFNLSIPAKSNAEYLFDMAEPLLAESKVVCIVTPATTFVPESYSLDQRKANMYRVLGYQVDEQAWQAYEQALPDSGVEYLLLPRWRHALDSRWRFVESVIERIEDPAAGMVGHARLDGGITGVGYSEDLKHASVPQAYTAVQTQRSFERRRAASPGLFEAGWHPTQTSLRAFEQRVDALAAASQGVVLAITPVHPLIADSMGPQGLAEFKGYVQGLAGSNVRVVDLSSAFDAAGFRDDVHISDEASVQLTEALVQELGLNAPDETGQTGG